MRKKDLITQNTRLFDKITVAQLKITELKEKIANRDAEIDGLKKEIEDKILYKNAFALLGDKAIRK